MATQPAPTESEAFSPETATTTPADLECEVDMLALGGVKATRMEDKGTTQTLT